MKIVDMSVQLINSMGDDEIKDYLKKYRNG